jgi:hypothetical protein
LRQRLLLTSLLIQFVAIDVIASFLSLRVLAGFMKVHFASQFFSSNVNPLCAIISPSS